MRDICDFLKPSTAQMLLNGFFERCILVLGAQFMTDVYVSDDQLKFDLMEIFPPETQERIKEYQAKRAKEEEELRQKAEAYWKERRQNCNPEGQTSTRETT